MRFNTSHILTILGLALLLVFYSEFLVYYIVLWQCHWPELASDHSHEAVLKCFFIADTHLLGTKTGHWFDKLRREWQMHRGFVTATSYLDPEVVFFLGDLFDEGKWASQLEFDDTVDRFHNLFPFDEKIVLVGNHDIGFHYDVTEMKRKRFYEAFNLEVTIIIIF
jgi:metallophosphoesterase superfamily enzyme